MTDISKYKKGNRNNVMFAYAPYLTIDQLFKPFPFRSH